MYSIFNVLICTLNIHIIHFKHINFLLLEGTYLAKLQRGEDPDLVMSVLKSATTIVSIDFCMVPYHCDSSTEKYIQMLLAWHNFQIQKLKNSGLLITLTMQLVQA